MLRASWKGRMEDPRGPNKNKSNKAEKRFFLFSSEHILVGKMGQWFVVLDLQFGHHTPDIEAGGRKATTLSF